MGMGSFGGGQGSESGKRSSRSGGLRHRVLRSGWAGKGRPGRGQGSGEGGHSLGFRRWGICLCSVSPEGPNYLGFGT